VRVERGAPLRPLLTPVDGSGDDYEDLEARFVQQLRYADDDRRSETLLLVATGKVLGKEHGDYIFGGERFSVGDASPLSAPLAARLHHPQALSRLIPDRGFILELTLGPHVGLDLSQARQVALQPGNILLRAF
jgi:hypothetical protein